MTRSTNGEALAPERDCYTDIEDYYYRDEAILAILPHCLRSDNGSDRYVSPTEANNRADGFIDEAMRRRQARREQRPQPDMHAACDSEVAIIDMSVGNADPCRRYDASHPPTVTFSDSDSSESALQDDAPRSIPIGGRTASSDLREDR